MGKETPQTKGGEVYRNRHGFLNGFWYRTGSPSERFGFIEGYVACLRHYVTHPAASYSQAIEYYDARISEYIAAHSNTDDEAIADILRRFRDNPKAN